MAEFARLEVDGGVGTIRLDRPKMNALDFQLQNELAELSAEASERDDIAAVVFYGGERVFAAGADIKEMADLTVQQMMSRSKALQGFTRAVADIAKPTVSAITGFALGGGCELALATDMRFVADNAKLGQPEILLGIIPGAGGTQRLSRLVGPAKAKDIMYSGRFVDATEALAIGLADRVLPADQVYSAAVEWARQFVGSASLALRAIKESVDRGLEVDLQTGLEIERMQFASLFATEDQKTGMASFIANGPGKASFEGQ